MSSRVWKSDKYIRSVSTGLGKAQFPAGTPGAHHSDDIPRSIFPHKAKDK